ncbi:MAG: S-layer protein [Candidatus Peregrinibacteria bacterium GW2011_GWF2_33_10]|nr:MAG: S-layer protein [Candidatus Peregrinibacteria bacterium GW2011_GWF2_33_10]
MLFCFGAWPVASILANFDNIDSLYYQISNDNEVWWYTVNNKWYIAKDNDSYCTLPELKSNISSFPVNGEELFLKAFTIKINNNSQNDDVTTNSPELVFKNTKPVVNFAVNPAQLNDGTGYVALQVNINDKDRDNTAMKVEYSLDGLSWSKASIKMAVYDGGDIAVDTKTADFQVGKNISIPTSLNEAKIFLAWDSRTDLADFDAKVKIRLMPYDGLEYGTAVKSDFFDLDNQAPGGLDDLLITQVSSNSASLKWNVVSGTNISRYSVFYGVNKTTVTNQVSAKINLNDMSLNKMTVEGLKADTLYYFMVTATDKFFNKKQSPIISVVTFPVADLHQNSSVNTNEAIDFTAIQTAHSSAEATNNETDDVDQVEGSTWQTTVNGVVATSNNEKMSITECMNDAFTDVPKDHWAYFYINKLHNLCLNGTAVLNGYGDGTFKPDQAISRFEFLRLLLTVNNIDFSGDIDASTDFFDLPKDNDNLVAKVIYRASFLNIVEGYSDGSFYPNSPINRAEAAKILLLASGLAQQNNIFSNFTDLPWYTGYVYEVINLGVMTGYSDGSFGVDNYLLRSEAAKIAYKIMVNSGEMVD